MRASEVNKRSSRIAAAALTGGLSALPIAAVGRAGGGAATSAAQGLGNFLASVSNAGLNATLEAAGLEYLIGQSVPDILAAILDLVAGPASTLDEAAARDAVFAGFALTDS